MINNIGDTEDGGQCWVWGASAIAGHQGHRDHRVHVPPLGLLPTAHLPGLVPDPLLGRGRAVKHVEVVSFILFPSRLRNVY